MYYSLYLYCTVIEVAIPIHIIGCKYKLSGTSGSIGSISTAMHERYQTPTLQIGPNESKPKEVSIQVESLLLSS